MLRGAFGHALKSTVCTMPPDTNCQKCMLLTSCAYTHLFETFVTKFPPSPFIKQFHNCPRPFIFEPSDETTEYGAGDILWFDLTLIGDAVDYLPYVIFAVFQMGKSGLGAKRYPFDLKQAFCRQQAEVEESSEKKQTGNPKTEWREIYSGSSQSILFQPHPLELKPGSFDTNGHTSLQMKFITPTRLLIKNELVTDFTPRQLTFKMVRRILELAYFYEGNHDISWEFHDLLDAADTIKTTQKNLRWKDQSRYSNRQRRKIKMGGFTGEIVWEGELSLIRDLVKYSEVLHVGKGTTFGLGKVGIKTN